MVLKKSLELDVWGEFLNEFVNCGLEGHGVDLSDYCKDFFPNLNFKRDTINEKLL